MPESDQFLYRSSSEVPYFSRDGESYLAEMPLRDIKKTLPLRVLSDEDYESLDTTLRSEAIEILNELDQAREGNELPSAP